MAPVPYWAGAGWAGGVVGAAGAESVGAGVVVGAGAAGSVVVGAVSVGAGVDVAGGVAGSEVVAGGVASGVVAGLLPANMK